jgi:hypothetical protein
MGSDGKNWFARGFELAGEIHPTPDNRALESEHQASSAFWQPSKFAHDCCARLKLHQGLV